MDLVLNILILKKEIISQVNCGNKIPDLAIYETISQYSIWIALAFVISAILFDQKKRKWIQKNLLMKWGDRYHITKE